jgi:DNA-binding CsgD family transcriptional regulator
VSGSISNGSVQRLARVCYSAGDSFGGIRAQLLSELQKVVPFDAAFIAGVDPESLLFTSVFADEALAPSSSLFVDNEFGACHDVNRFVDLARATDPVASLDDATSGERGASARWREIMGPLGMGDELRVALRVDGVAWGFLCLHRSGATGFNSHEMMALRRVAPHAAEAFRRSAVAITTAPASASEAVVLTADHLVLAVAGAVEEIEGDALTVGGRLPMALAAVARRLEAIERGEGGPESPTPAIRMRSRSGALVTVHGSRLDDGSGTGPIVLTIAPATSSARSTLLLAGYGLTPAQCRVATGVLRGWTTGQIVTDLCISAHTVQDHLKVVFDKVGVRSRRELVSAFMHPSRPSVDDR